MQALDGRGELLEEYGVGEGFEADVLGFDVK